MKRLPKQKRLRVMELYLQGLTQNEIANALNISQWSVGSEIEFQRHQRCPQPDEAWNFCPWCGVNLDSRRLKQAEQADKKEKRELAKLWQARERKANEKA